MWPTRSGDPYSDHINSMPKCVVSSTLTGPEWANASVISGDPVTEIQRLKEAQGEDVVRSGSARSRTRCSSTGCWTSSGSGYTRSSSASRARDMLRRAGATALFELVDSTSLENGVVILSYQTRNGA